MTIQKLPQELYDRIIDMLKGDLQTLKSCALVMRDWLDRSRTYLFEEITIVCDSAIPLEFYNSPDLTRLVRKVNVFAAYDCEDNMIYPIASTSSVAEVTSGQLLSRFPLATELVLAGFQVKSSFLMKDRDAWRTAFPLVTRLTLRSWTTPLRTFLVFLSAFPRLEHLQIESLTLLPSQASPSALSPTSCAWFPRPPLVSLCLVGYFDFPRASVLELSKHWISSASQTFADGFTFTWACMQPDACVALPAVLEALGTSVVSLDISVGLGRRIIDIGSTGIEHCTNVRNLVLRHAYHGALRGSLHFDLNAEWIPHLLLQVRSDILKTLIIKLWCGYLFSQPHPLDLQSIDFAQIAKALCGPKFAGLTTININVPRDEKNEALVMQLKQDLHSISSMKEVGVGYDDIVG